MLRFYRPSCGSMASEMAEADDDNALCDDALCDVVPRAGRLVLFASDQRCPHEVLPITAISKVRFGIALWYTEDLCDRTLEARRPGASGSSARVGIDSSIAIPTTENLRYQPSI